MFVIFVLNLKLEGMKTIEEASLENSKNHYIMAFSEELHKDADMDFRAGVEFAQRWYSVEEELPETEMGVIVRREAYSVYSAISRFNKSLLKIYKPGLYKYGSFYFTHWRPIELK